MALKHGIEGGGSKSGKRRKGLINMMRLFIACKLLIPDNGTKLIHENNHIPDGFGGTCPTACLELIMFAF